MNLMQHNVWINFLNSWFIWMNNDPTLNGILKYREYPNISDITRYSYWISSFHFSRIDKKYSVEKKINKKLIQIHISNTFSVLIFNEIYLDM